MSAEIRYLGDPARHFWLTRSVARTMGLNLSAAMAAGRLSATGYAEMVNTCRKCPNTSQCEAWLASSRAGPSDAPAHCANAAAFQRLARNERG